MRNKKIILAVFALGLFSGFGNSNAFAIISFNPSDGATDAEHVALGALPRFGAGGWFAFTDTAAGTTRYESATLVSADWVVTSASNVTTSLGAPLLLSGMKVGFGANALTDSVSYSITQIIRPPLYSPDTGANDIAFLKLASPVTDITPAMIYQGSLLPGQAVATLGHGQAGTPASGLSAYDGIERAMINQISGIDPAVVLGFTNKFAMTQFEPDPTLSDFEYLGGTTAPGDTGGGLMVDDHGVWKLAGISTFNFNSPDYFADDFYSQMSTFIPYINNQPALVSLVPEPVGISAVMMIGAVGLLRRRRVVHE